MGRYNEDNIIAFIKDIQAEKISDGLKLILGD